MTPLEHLSNEIELIIRNEWKVKDSQRVAAVSGASRWEVAKLKSGGALSSSSESLLRLEFFVRPPPPQTTTTTTPPPHQLGRAQGGAGEEGGHRMVTDSYLVGAAEDEASLRSRCDGDR